MKHQLKKIAFSIARAGKLLPYGIDFASDLNRRFPRFDIETIFDVGANIGQSVELFSGRFPRSIIYSFEPDPQTFSILASRIKRRASCFQIALSDCQGKMRFDNTSPVSEIHSLSHNQDDISLPFVDVTTVDKFCAEHQINNIDILKIDAEGNELNIIDGSISLIQSGKIKTIFAECSLMSTPSKRLVPFSKMQIRMKELGFACLGIYHQTPSWSDPTNPEINTCNCLFVSSALGPARI